MSMSMGLICLSLSIFEHDHDPKYMKKYARLILKIEYVQINLIPILSTRF